MAWMETSDEWGSSGVIQELALFSITGGDMNCGTECILSMFADNVPEGRDAIWRGLWLAWEVGLWKPHSSARPRARLCTCVRAIPSANTNWMENRFRADLRKKTWECWLTSSSVWPGYVDCKFAAQKLQPYLRLHQKKMNSKLRILCLPLHSCAPSLEVLEARLDGVLSNLV